MPQLDINMRLIFLAATLAVSSQIQAATPAKPPAVAREAVSQDPVGSFKELVAAAAAPNEWTNVQQNAHTQKWSKQHFTAGEIKFDVKKTDSLISPVRGIVSFPVAMRMSEFFNTKEEAEQSTPGLRPRLTSYLTGEYVLIDGAWRLDKFSYYSAFGDGPPSRDIEVINRDKLSNNLGNGTGMALILEKWYR